MKTLARDLTHTLRKWNMPILIVAAILGMMCSNTLAQSGAGSIKGTVTDSSDAVIAGASIHVVQHGTNMATDAKTNRVGFYQVPGLFTGTYTVTISAPGMKRYAQTVELLVDQAAVINANMTMGSVTQEVIVAANPVQLITTDSGTITSTLENSRINQLPMNGRNLITLTNETTPGLDSCAQSTSCANGMMPGATEYVVDGATLAAREFGGASAGQTAMPDPDSVQEVRMETSGGGAQYGTPAAGVITTKSGTNQLHGTLFETARNNAFGIARQRQDPANFVAPPYVRNEFGASIGGPIIIPHLYNGKDKSFFFFAYERYSLAQTRYNNMNTPTMAMRNGDFSGLINKSGVLQQLYDPATTTSSSNCNGTGVANQSCRSPFQGNQIPINRLSPTAKVIYAITPHPTTADNPLVTSNLTARNPSYTVAPTITFRLDHQFNENNRAYLRYTSVITTNTALRSASEPATVAATVNGFNFPANATGVQYLPTALFAASAGFTHIFSPTFFSETVVSQQWLNQSNFAGGSPSTNFEAELGTPNNFGETGFPSFSNNLNNMNGTMYQYGITQIIDNLDENLTQTVGRNQIQFGGRYRHERFGYLENQQLDKIDFGAYATALENPGSGANYTATPNTGYADADQFLGAAADYSVNLQPPYVHFHDMEFDAYLQDNYHVKNLTLNFGVRYEAHPAPLMKDGTLTGFDLKNDAEVLGAPVASLIAKGYTTQAIITNIQKVGGKIETPQEAGMPSAMTNNYDFNLLPRVGVAWQPFGSRWGTVLRGGYGIYIYPTPLYFSMAAAGGNGGSPFTARYTESYVTANQSPDGLPNYLLRSPQTVIAGVNSANVVDSNSTTSILPGIPVTSIDPDAAPDRVTQANVTIEQPMKGNSALRVSWIYSHDANLWNFYQYNNHPSAYVWEMQTGTVPPNGGASAIGTNQYSTTATGPYDKTTWGNNRLVQKTGWSTDNALQVNYQRLFHHGIAYQISYVWSKAMNTSGESGGTGIVYPTADFANSAVSTMTSPYGTVIAPNPAPRQPTGVAPYASFQDLIRYENYKADTNFPKHRIRFNGIVDLPIGRGKWLLGNSNRFVNELVGGFQIAEVGSIVSQSFAITSTNWGPTNPIHVYKHKVPISDCRSGVCHKEFEWFNGYVAPTADANVACTTNCIYGLPSGVVPYQTPIDNIPGTKYYGGNEVNITLPGKAPAAIAYSPASNISGANPFSKTILDGPMNWTADVSIFKVFPITQQANLRFNMDAFNVFNVQGQNNPNATDGTQSFLSSHNAARQLQFTLRLTF